MRYEKTGKSHGPMLAGLSAKRAQGDLFSTAAPTVHRQLNDTRRHQSPTSSSSMATIQSRVSSRDSCFTAAVVRPLHEQEADDNSDADEESKS